MKEKATPIINHTVMVCDPSDYSVVNLNKYSDADDQPNRELSFIEHTMFTMALENAGITVRQAVSSEGCQDAIYTANWGLCDEDMVVLANLPGPRRDEERLARDMFSSEMILGRDKKRVLIKPPEKLRFSGQGDALICDDTLFVGSGYRTSPEMVPFLRDAFNGKYNVVGVNTVPMTDEDGIPMINKLSGWEDSEFYDIDLAIGVVAPRKIIWCPEAFKPESQDLINGLGFETVEITRDEATETFVCNGIGNGIDSYIVGKPVPEHVISGLAEWGIRATSLHIPELQKGGGSTRCMANTVRMYA